MTFQYLWKNAEAAAATAAMAATAPANSYEGTGEGASCSTLHIRPKLEARIASGMANVAETPQ